MSGKSARNKRKGINDPTTQDFQKPKQEVGKCIFCQNPGDLSKQHIWPAWIQEVIEDVNPKTRHTKSGIFSDSGYYHNYKIYNGRPGAQRLRKVCASCNSGWINNEVEAKMRPIFTDIIQNKLDHISKQDQLNLSLWAVLATMVYEFRDIPTMATTQIEREFLYKNRQIPSRWQVWIGKMEPDPDFTQWIHHRGIELKFPGYPSEGLPCNTQCTAFAVGNLVLVTSKTPEFIINFSFLGSIGEKLMPIYPSISESINWSKLRNLSSNEVVEIASAFTQEILKPAI